MGHTSEAHKPAKEDAEVSSVDLSYYGRPLSADPSVAGWVSTHPASPSANLAAFGSSISD